MIQESYPDWPEAKAKRQLQAARYVVHRLSAHKYAVAVMRGEMDVDLAHKHYQEAMRNFDGIVSNAASGHSSEANAEDMAKGEKAIDDILEIARRG